METWKTWEKHHLPSWKRHNLPFKWGLAIHKTFRQGTNHGTDQLLTASILCQVVVWTGLQTSF
jgi:hypothetical protein